MKFLVTDLLLFLFFLTACNSNEEVKAHIFERKQLDSTQLQIKYRYEVDKQRYVDSASIENVVLPNDTITIVLEKNDPTKTTPSFSK